MKKVIALTSVLALSAIGMACGDAAPANNATNRPATNANANKPAATPAPAMNTNSTMSTTNSTTMTNSNGTTTTNSMTTTKPAMANSNAKM